jgi:iron-sulfur cluster repair protein YtfE (RIC family)
VIGIGGRRGGGNEDAVDALLECHDRIRQMTALARALAGARDRDEGEIGEAAARVRRYFSESLVRHVEDEEESLLPRLRGRDPQVDAALDRMASEHIDHGELVARLVSTCSRIEQRPTALPELRADLAQVTAALAEQFAVHLESEEQIVFPAVRRLLDAHERSSIRAEMRARRQPR